MAYFLLFALTLFIFGIIIKAFLSKDRSKIWSPVIFFCLYLTYYILLPTYTTDTFGNFSDGTLNETVIYVLLGALLNLFSFYLGFYVINAPKYLFYNFNRYFDKSNARKCALILFIVGFSSYVAVRGFSLNVFHSGDEMFEEMSYTNHIEAYILNLISGFSFVACLLIVTRSKLLWPILVVSILIFIIGGFRFRIAMLLVIVGTFYHLYPNPKKINWKLFLPLFIFFYLSMGIIEQTRTYGHGLNLDKLQSIKSESIEPAKENVVVCRYSAMVMEKYDSEEKLYFEAIKTALLMPFPRQFFPWKPDGAYQIDAQLKTYGVVQGAAMLEFVEAFICFGWIGILFNGICYGFLAGIFWKNYLKNKNSVGALILLSTFNGLLYVMVSRGYLAQIFLLSVYYIFVPFWTIYICSKFWKRPLPLIKK